MKKINKKLFLTLAALLLVAGISMESVLAYFTTYATAKGTIQMNMGATDTEIEEEVVGGQKRITVKNTGSFDCFVRIKALSGESYPLEYSEPEGGSNWSEGSDGYYYYKPVLPAGETTSQINVKITFPDNSEKDEDEQISQFNVIIVQEWTPVRYDENGEAYAEWDKAIESVGREAGGE